MAHRPTMQPTTPLLPGWGPLVEPPRRLHAASVLRWWWPTAMVIGFLALVAVVGGRDDPAPGLSMRSLVTLTLAAAALTILTIRRRFGPWALARALAEYAVLVLLVALLATSSAVPPAERALANSPRPPATAATGSQPAPRDLPSRRRRPAPGRRRPLAGRAVGPGQGHDRAALASSTQPQGGAMTKFRHLPVAGRPIIVTVAIGVFAIAVVACATSYNAIYRLVGDLGLYGYRINQAFPLMLDAAFLVAELAAILGGIMRAVTRSDEVSVGWPGTTMLLCGAGTIGFNIAHAYLIGGRGDPLTIWRCVVASLPPVLMILSFQVLIAIVKWVMLHLGRPLNSAAALAPTMPVPGYGLAPPPAPTGCSHPTRSMGRCPAGRLRKTAKRGTRA